jgi:ATP-binding cassette subfamily C protein
MGLEFDDQNLEFDQRYQLRGNQKLLLNDPEKIWLVQSGVVAIFAVSIQNQALVGARRYLFSCEPGEVLFGAVPSGDRGRGIMAVSLEKTTLLLVSRASLAQSTIRIGGDERTLLETWMQKFAGAVQVEKGTSDVAIDLIETSSETELVAAQSSLDLDIDRLLSLNTNFLGCLNQIEAQEQAEAQYRLQLRNRFNRQTTLDMMAELATLLQPKPSSPEVGNSTVLPEFLLNQPEYLSLYQAAQAVGRALGMTIQLPTASENLKRVKKPLDAIARASQIRVRRVLLSDRWWQSDCGSLLAYTRQDHRPVALISVAAKHYQLFDPVQGTYTTIGPEERSLLAPVAYVFYRSLPERAIQALDILRFSLRGTRRDWLTLIWAGAATTLIGMLLPQATAILIDRAIPSADRGLLIEIGCGLLAAVGGGTLFQIVQGFALIRIETFAETTVQAALWDRLLSLSIPFFRQYSTGNLQERVSVISAIRRQISGATLKTLFTSSLALLNLFLLFYYSPFLAAIASLFALLTVLLTVVSGILTLQQVLPLQELEGQIFGLMVQLINGVAKLRVAGAEERAFAYWGKRYRQQQQLKLNIQQIEDNLAVFNQVLPIASSAILFTVVVRLLQTATSPSGLSIGTFLAFNVAFGIFIAGVVNLSTIAINILAVFALWKRAKPILMALPEVDSGKTDPGRLSGQLALNQVTFHYRQNSPPVLNQVSLTAEPGEFIAVVGPSGSGKSTLFRLLLGFESPQIGQVSYDGQSLSGLNIHAVRRQIGVLLQNSRTSTASIFETIAGNALITMDDAWAAARYAGLADEIAAMPMGMHTVVSEGGSNLSGGQRQRLLIARALALKPQILLFDEATSSLDNQTQAIVSESLKELQITRIVIAHRLSTIQDADRIYVLEASRVVQQGSFKQLMSQQGLFLKLMQRQMA